MLYCVEYVGKVQAQQRTLSVVRQTAEGRHYAKPIDKPESRNFKATLAMLANKELEAKKGQPIEGPCSIALHVSRAVPTSWSKKKRLEAESGKIHPTSRPDLDNVLKGVMDAFSGILYKDDKQVVKVLVSKSYGRFDGFTCFVRELTEDDDEK